MSQSVHIADWCWCFYPDMRRCYLSLWHIKMTFFWITAVGRLHLTGGPKIDTWDRHWVSMCRLRPRIQGPQPSLNPVSLLPVMLHSGYFTHPPLSLLSWIILQKKQSGWWLRVLSFYHQLQPCWSFSFPLVWMEEVSSLLPRHGPPSVPWTLSILNSPNLIFSVIPFFVYS